MNHDTFAGDWHGNLAVMAAQNVFTWIAGYDGSPGQYSDADLEYAFSDLSDEGFDPDDPDYDDF